MEGMETKKQILLVAVPRLQLVEPLLGQVGVDGARERRKGK